MVLWIDKQRIKERTTEDGTEQIGVQLNSVDSVLFMLDNLIENGKGNVKLNAIKFLWEQLDGKAKQTVENRNSHSIEGIDFEFTPATDGK